VTNPVPFIHSRDNPLVKDLKRLAQDNGAYRKQGRVAGGRSPVPRGAGPGLAAGAGGVFRVLLASGPVDLAQAAIKT
jgi:TrmH family RNA methyltransferase